MTLFYEKGLTHEKVQTDLLLGKGLTWQELQADLYIIKI